MKNNPQIYHSSPNRKYTQLRHSARNSIDNKEKVIDFSNRVSPKKHYQQNMNAKCRNDKNQLQVLLVSYQQIQQKLVLCQKKNKLLEQENKKLMLLKYNQTEQTSKSLSASQLTKKQSSGRRDTLLESTNSNTQKIRQQLENTLKQNSQFKSLLQNKNNQIKILQEKLKPQQKQKKQTEKHYDKQFQFHNHFVNLKDNKNKNSSSRQKNKKVHKKNKIDDLEIDGSKKLKKLRSMGNLSQHNFCSLCQDKLKINQEGTQNQERLLQKIQKLQSINSKLAKKCQQLRRQIPGAGYKNQPEYVNKLLIENEGLSKKIKQYQTFIQKQQNGMQKMIFSFLEEKKTLQNRYIYQNKTLMEKNKKIMRQLQTYRRKLSQTQSEQKLKIGEESIFSKKKSQIYDNNLRYTDYHITEIQQQSENSSNTFQRAPRSRIFSEKLSTSNIQNV